MKNNYINHFNYSLNINHKKNDQTILSSIFTYYNGSYDIKELRKGRLLAIKRTVQITDELE